MSMLRARRTDRRVIWWSTALLVGATALLVACGSDGGGSASATGARADAGDASAALRILAPANDATVSESFTVKLASDEALGTTDTGRHHVHLYYDGKTDEGEYDFVYANTFKVERLRPGSHTIRASLRNADHSDAGPATTIKVTVADGGSTTTSTTPGGGSGGYGY